MKLYRKLLPAFVILFLSAGCGRHSSSLRNPPSPSPASSGVTPHQPSVTAEPRAVAQDHLTASECFPLAVKNRWLYQVADSKGHHYDSEFDVERTDRIGGKLFFVSVNTVTNQPNSFSRMYYTHTRFGLSIFRIITTQNRYSEITDYGRTDGLPVNLPEKLRPGKRWITEVPAHIYSTRTTKPYRLQGRALNFERVKVPAGVFEALKVTTTTEYAGKQSKTTAWYAPGVGQVKFVNITGSWRHEYLLKAAEINHKVVGKF